MSTAIRSSLCLRDDDSDPCSISLRFRALRHPYWVVHDIDTSRGRTDKPGFDSLCGWIREKKNPHVRIYLNERKWHHICREWELLGYVDCEYYRSHKSKVRFTVNITFASVERS